MSRSTPSTAILLGLLGLLGFVGCGLIAMVEDPTTSGQGLNALIANAAVMLSFIGAVHWGLALGAGTATRRVQRLRYTLGVLPALIGWVALLLPLFVPPWTSLVLLTAGFIASMVVEARWAHLGFTPGRYTALHWLVTVVVVAMLGCVLVIRLVGAHISF